MSKWAAYEGYPLVALRNLKGIERLTLHKCSYLDARFVMTRT